MFRQKSDTVRQVREKSGLSGMRDSDDVGEVELKRQQREMMIGPFFIAGSKLGHDDGRRSRNRSVPPPRFMDGGREEGWEGVGLFFSRRNPLHNRCASFIHPLRPQPRPETPEIDSRLQVVLSSGGVVNRSASSERGILWRMSLIL